MNMSEWMNERKGLLTLHQMVEEMTSTWPEINPDVMSRFFVQDTLKKFVSGEFVHPKHLRHMERQIQAFDKGTQGPLYFIPGADKSIPRSPENLVLRDVSSLPPKYQMRRDDLLEATILSSSPLSLKTDDGAVSVGVIRNAIGSARARQFMVSLEDQGDLANNTSFGTLMRKHSSRDFDELFVKEGPSVLDGIKVSVPEIMQSQVCIDGLKHSGYDSVMTISESGERTMQALYSDQIEISHNPLEVKLEQEPESALAMEFGMERLKR